MPEMTGSSFHANPIARNSAVETQNGLHLGGQTGEIDTVVSRLDAWFETIRSSSGYGGPVAHWWQQSLLYTGAGLDWRYEGIIDGYLTLWDRTGNDLWLRKAIRAGDDLVAGQRADGHFRASAFEQNPATGGTPHEAACDVALLLLAGRLKETGDDQWTRYADCARRNLERAYIGRLWNPSTCSINDDPDSPAFVPNKAATASEALILHSQLTGDVEWTERYVVPTLDRVISHQIRDGSELDGAIAQNSFADRVVEKYFPVYVARCVSGLVRGYTSTEIDAYLEAAARAMSFITRWIDDDGSIPTVIYPTGRASRYPAWVAPLGDVLRAGQLLAPHGFDADLDRTSRWLLAGADESGGIQTARGFAAQSGGDPGTPDVRDVLHVAGWCDKAFRYLSKLTGPDIPDHAEISTFSETCCFRGVRVRFTETTEMIEISGERDVLYRWRKQQSWPEIASPKFWLR